MARVSHLLTSQKIIYLEMMQFIEKNEKTVAVDYYEFLGLWHLQQKKLKPPIDRGRVEGVRLTDESILRGL
ncbi:hypothetical protein NDA07_05545 [Microcoleus vaginatus DQ-U2]|uniref:hypothetical protein n=1 Tax=Microcoleus vaginatus TaxID=119532 RepID=UPI0016835464|nr:hypothetical protein [Microcoleus sp. FACHB-DQ6]